MISTTLLTNLWLDLQMFIWFLKSKNIHFIFHTFRVNYQWLYYIVAQKGLSAKCVMVFQT